MDELRSTILEYNAKSKNDSEFITHMDKLIADKGDVVCQVFFHIFTDLDFIPQEAKEYWSHVISHRDEMVKRLDREINLIPAMCDYFCLNTPYFHSPKLVDLKTFDQVIKKSTHDILTGLLNRQYFKEILDQQLSYSKRYSTDLSVLFIDVDDFKEVNDTFGHKAGDESLRLISKAIMDEKRDSDAAFRYGGEEFVVLMPNTDNLSAIILAERIREKVEGISFKPNGVECKLTVSGGLATYPIHAQNAVEIINYADSALYRAKGAGKNNISLFKKDNRRFLRIKLNKDVKVKELGFKASQISFGRSKDIGIGGILFENNEKVEIGTNLQVSLLINDDTPLLLIGTVVRVEAVEEGRYDIGMSISFREMDKIAKNEITHFLTEQSRKAYQI